MKSEFTVTIYRNDDHYSYSDLQLPAKWSEYQDALQRARIFNNDTPYAVELVQWNREYFRSYADAEDVVNADRGLLELNLLAHRLDMLDETLQDGFAAMVKLETQNNSSPDVLIPLAKLINMTFAANEYLPAYGVFNDTMLGDFLYENDMLSDTEYDMVINAQTALGGDEPPKELLALIGQKRRKQENGVFTEQGYFECPAEIPEVYKPGEMGYFDRSGAPVVLEICKEHFNDPEYDNEKTAVLDCPVNDRKLTKALEAVDVVSIEEIGWRCTDCLIPAAKEWIDNEDDYDTVQDFAAFLYQMERKESPEAQVKYKAILEAINCDSLGKALYFGTELDEYYFYPEMTSPADFGKEMLIANHGQDAATLSDYMNFDLYGKHMMREFNAVNTGYGILRRTDGGPIQSEVPEERQEESVSVDEIYTSQDFQCDHTSGYPTVLVWNQDNGTAILQPAPAFDDGSEEANQCIRECAEWGVNPCSSLDDFNNLLETIGKDAVRNAWVSADDEPEEFGMGGIM